MKKPCNKYTSEDISRFVDNELPRDRYHTLKQHLHHCPDCSLLIEQYKSISAVFNDHADQQGLKIDAAKLKQKFNTAIQNSKKKSLENVFGFFGRNIYLKLASITAILMISLFMFQGDGDLFDPAGPSAIVKSVDTDFASVMIIETQKEKHTIIWFSET
ncbi:MAG: zf-HC2 domain-containing protein [Desulfobacula sp.]|uniref:anti-sigma factor family protein n=1 Tax=Desulfobacula sp. TaxID=2593537 RepID=UPI0025C5E2B9|nr:zf-HC2 domain-containing protein [Desulfobacula sp.]MCD4721136.1 zf-HC2 domain-containing protein [Desulfobacula sp.]